MVEEEDEEDSRSMAPPRNTVPVAGDPGCDMSDLEAKNTLGCWKVLNISTCGIPILFSWRIQLFPSRE